MNRDNPNSSTQFASAKIKAQVCLIQQFIGSSFYRILVVGCGSGIEAAALAQEFQTEVIGIDLEPAFDEGAAQWADLRPGDATQLAFDEGSFDLIYSFHVLEHIPLFRQALMEMRRVLRPGGGYLIGTPNRARLIGYLGSQTATLTEKWAWNWADWKARWQGKFRNEFGAHAGFLSTELKTELEKVFGRTEDITGRYYQELYSKFDFLIRIGDRAGLGKWFFPAVYFIGRKD